jgi:hypothetical protein
MFRRLICLLFLFLLTTAAIAQTGGGLPGVPLGTTSEIDMATKKRVLLSNYCRLDFEGARLRPDGWSRFKPYATMRSNPEYSRIVVVTRFNVEPPETATLSYVGFQQVGYYDEIEGYVASAASERVEFHMEEHRDEVLVTAVSPGMPHVSPRAAIAWMNQRLADPKTSDVERNHLKGAVDKLSKFLPQPRPATAPPGV